MLKKIGDPLGKNNQVAPLIDTINYGRAHPPAQRIRFDIQFW